MGQQLDSFGVVMEGFSEAVTVELDLEVRRALLQLSKEEKDSQRKNTSRALEWRPALLRWQ